MHILFDQGTPVPLRPALAGHLVDTVYEMGWSELENGELLKLAEATFDIFINIRAQIKVRAAQARLIDGPAQLDSLDLTGATPPSLRQSAWRARLLAIGRISSVGKVRGRVRSRRPAGPVRPRLGVSGFG